MKLMYLHLIPVTLISIGTYKPLHTSFPGLEACPQVILWDISTSAYLLAVFSWLKTGSCQRIFAIIGTERRKRQHLVSMEKFQLKTAGIKSFCISAYCLAAAVTQLHRYVHTSTENGPVTTKRCQHYLTSNCTTCLDLAWPSSDIRNLQQHREQHVNMDNILSARLKSICSKKYISKV